MIEGYMIINRDRLCRMGHLPGNIAEALERGDEIERLGGNPQYAYHKDEHGVVDIQVYDLDELSKALLGIKIGCPSEPIRPKKETPPWTHVY